MLKSENAQTKMGKKWTDHCRKNCIEQTTKELHSTLENYAEPNIGQLGSMVRNVMREFDVPLKEHYWAQKLSVDVQNIASSKKLNVRCPLEISEGNT